MADLSVRLGWASNLTKASRAALTALADVDKASVSGAPNGETDDGLNVNTATAEALVWNEYAERTEDGGIVITRDGLIKIGRIVITRAERQRIEMQRSLKAQAEGEWKPAPAGESAAASKK